MLVFFQKNGHVSSEGIRNGLVYGQNDVTPQRDARIMKLGTSLGQPQCVSTCLF